MATAVADDYRAVIEAAGAAGKRPAAERRRAAAKLRRTLHRVSARDFFPPPEQHRAERAVERLVA